MGHYSETSDIILFNNFLNNKINRFSFEFGYKHIHLFLGFEFHHLLFDILFEELYIDNHIICDDIDNEIREELKDLF